MDQLVELPEICRLHIGLYLLADKRLILPLDLEMLANEIFGGEDPGLYEMLSYLREWKMLDFGEGEIHLPGWPQGRTLKAASKSDNLALTKGSAPYHPTREDTKAMEGDGRKLKGLYGADPKKDFDIFADHFPHKLTKQMRQSAYNFWCYLAAGRQMPPITVMLAALKESPPKTSSATVWLKSKPWTHIWQGSALGRRSCPYCLDQGHRIILNDKGEKEHIVCKCRGSAV